MLSINTNYELIAASYLFSTISQKVKAFQDANPGKEIIKMGIGDAIFPIPKVSVEAAKKAFDEIGTEEGFRKYGGYGPEQGYSWLREKIAEVKFKGACKNILRCSSREAADTGPGIRTTGTASTAQSR